MANLRQTQQALQDFLQGKASDIQQYIVGKTAEMAKRRLVIYQEAYQLRLQENLFKQYPVLAAKLGSEAFIKLANAYDQHYPAKDFAIRRYGQFFPLFLQNATELNEAQRLCLAELAQFEWAMNVALDDSADGLLLTTESLQKISPEALPEQRFAFQASLQWLTFEYDVPAWWSSKANNDLPKKLAAPLTYAVWRRALLPYYRAITEPEQPLIAAVQHQASFAKLCEIAAYQQDEEAAMQMVVTTLLRWLQDQWLTLASSVQHDQSLQSAN